MLEFDWLNVASDGLHVIAWLSGSHSGLFYLVSIHTDHVSSVYGIYSELKVTGDSTARPMRKACAIHVDNRWWRVDRENRQGVCNRFLDDWFEGGGTWGMEAVVLCELSRDCCGYEIFVWECTELGDRIVAYKCGNRTVCGVCGNLDAQPLIVARCCYRTMSGG